MSKPPLILGSKMRTISIGKRELPVVDPGDGLIEGELIAEYKTSAGDTISISKSHSNCWDVDCWKPSGDNHWNKNFDDILEAYEEYTRWRHL